MDTASCKHGKCKVKGNLIVCKSKGVFTNDFADKMFNCIEHIEDSSVIGYSQFHDLKDVYKIDLQFEDIPLIERKERRSKVKAAFLVSNPAVFGCVHVYKKLMEDMGFEVHVSYEIGSIAAFLDVPVDLLEAW